MEFICAPSRVAFSIGNFDIYWYGIIIACAILFDFVLIFFLCKFKKYDKDLPFDLILATVPAGIICARLFSCIFEDGTSILNFFNFRDGGLSIIGGVLGGAISVGLYCLIKKKNFFEISDIIMPLVILAQAIGRWGNFFNQEVYGKEILDPALQWFPFAVHITSGGVDGYFMALFFYESMLNLIGFALLLTLFLTVKKKKGIVVGTYFMYYGGIRFFLEMLRDERYVLRMLGLPISQVISGIMFFAGLGILIYVIFFQEKVRQKIKYKKGVKTNEVKR